MTENAAWNRELTRRQRELEAFHRLCLTLGCMLVVWGLVWGITAITDLRQPRTVTAATIVQQGDSLWDLWNESTRGRANWDWWRAEVRERSPAYARGQWLTPGEILYVPAVPEVAARGGRWREVRNAP